MISDAEAAAEGWSFNYTAAQWSIIAELVNRHCPHKELFAYRELLQAANSYLCGQSLRLKDSEWRVNAKSMTRMLFLMYEMHEGTFLKGNLFEGLNAIEKLAADFARHFGCSCSKLNPKKAFYYILLDLWGEAGGPFRRSRSKPNETGTRLGGEAGGPTVRYFEAAAGPVMNDDAPGRERICQLIVEHRESDKKVDKVEAALLRRWRRPVDVADARRTLEEMRAERIAVHNRTVSKAAADPHGNSLASARPDFTVSTRKQSET
jgi:hypothetical protein